MEVLKECYDPELGFNVVDMGFIYDVKISDGKVKIKMSLTSPFCPMASMIDSEIREKVGKIKGVKIVHTELVWDPPWSPDRMDKKVREQLGI